MKKIIKIKIILNFYLEIKFKIKLIDIKYNK